MIALTSIPFVLGGTLGKSLAQPLNNNISECAPKVQSAINNLRHLYGHFDIDCRNGFVRELSVELNSSISKEAPEEFAAKHWELFISSAPKRPLEFKTLNLRVAGFFEAEQQYKGHSIRNRFAQKQRTRENGSILPKDVWRFLISIVDTSSWNFEPKVKLTCDAAVELGKKHDEKQGITTGWTYKCYARNVEFDGDSFPEGPKLIWAVAAWRKIPNKGPNANLISHKVSLRIFHVDVDSEQVVELPKKK